MYYPSLTFDRNIIDAVRSASARVPDVAADYFEQTVKPALEQAVQVYVAPYPGAVKHPFQFTGDEFNGGKLVRAGKSRRAYWATRGFGRGVPYARTGFLGVSWRVRIDRRRTDGIITLRNLAPYAENVIGDVHQTPGHAETGWGGETLSDGIAQFNTVATNQLVDAWPVIVDRAIEAGL